MSCLKLYIEMNKYVYIEYSQVCTYVHFNLRTKTSLHLFINLSLSLSHFFISLLYFTFFIFFSLLSFFSFFFFFFAHYKYALIWKYAWNVLFLYNNTQDMHSPAAFCILSLFFILPLFLLFFFFFLYFFLQKLRQYTLAKSNNNKNNRHLQQHIHTQLHIIGEIAKIFTIKTNILLIYKQIFLIFDKFIMPDIYLHHILQL